MNIKISAKSAVNKIKDRAKTESITIPKIYVDELEILSKSKNRHVDASFKVAPIFYMQLFTIDCWF